jgi:hypothetical protein
LRPASFESLPHFHERGLAQHVEMTAEIAVGERAESAQLGELQTVGMRDERRQDAEPRLFVQRAIESFISKPARLGVAGRLTLLSSH